MLSSQRYGCVIKFKETLLFPYPTPTVGFPYFWLIKPLILPGNAPYLPPILSKNALNFAPYISNSAPYANMDSMALCRKLQVVLHHHSILHHGHHPPWVGICFGRSLWGLLHTPLRLAGKQSTKVNRFVGRSFSIVNPRSSPDGRALCQQLRTAKPADHQKEATII